MVFPQYIIRIAVFLIFFLSLVLDLFCPCVVIDFVCLNCFVLYLCYCAVVMFDNCAVEPSL